MRADIMCALGLRRGRAIRQDAANHLGVMPMHFMPKVITFAAALAATAVPASAQTYPTRPINMVVPFPAGGNTDIMARALQNEISKALRQTVVVVNKGGAAGTLGINDVLKATPDGYTIALTPNNPLTAQPHLVKLAYS